MAPAMPNAPIVRLTTFKSASNSLLRVATYGRGIWQIPLASAQSTLTTATLAPTSLSFPDQPVQTAGSPQTLTLTNSGSIPLTVTQITVGADFAESDNCSGLVAAGGSCTLQLTFLPTQLGALAETLTILGNLPGGQLTASLSGNGVAGAAIVLLPTVMNFGSAAIGTTTAAQNLTISNTGGIPIHIGTPGLSGDFQLSVNTCGSSLAVNTGCTVSIRFAPTASGERTGTLAITDDLGTQTAQLSGTGQSGATDLLSPLSLVFADQVVTTVSPAQPVTLSNNGDLSLSEIQVTVTGDFMIANSCGTSLIGHSTCSISVSYLPTHTGPAIGTLTIADKLNPAGQIVSLSGNGLSAAGDSLSPGSLVFAGQTLNSASAPQSVTLSNTGDATLTSIAGQITGDFTLSNGCGPSLRGHTSCLMNVAYMPTQVGPQSGILTVTDANGSQTVSLRGTGLSSTSLSAMPTALTFPGQILGSPSTPQPVTLTNNTSIAISGLSTSISGDYSIATTTCSASLAAGASCALQIVFTPSDGCLRTGALSVTGSTLPAALAIPLNGTGLSDTISPLTLVFADQVAKTTSTSQPVLLTNSGSCTLTDLAVQINGDFALTNGCGTSLGPHLSCGFNVTFTPSQTGAETGTLTVTDALRSQSVLLSGTGISPATSSLAPLSLVFAGQVLNVASTSQKVVLTNGGDVPLTGIDAQASGDFVLKSSCSTSLAAHSACNLNVSYLPTHTGLESVTLTVIDAVNSQTVALTGTGLAPATDTISPQSLAFPDQPLNVASAAQKVSLTNSGDVALTGITAQVSGDFVLKNSCSASLAAHSSCTLNVIFQPTQPGLESGVLTVTDGLQSQLVALTGTGLAGPQDTLSTTALDFGGQLVNSSSAVQTVTLANMGDETLAGVSAQVTGDFVLKSGCGASLAARSTCALSVV